MSSLDKSEADREELWRKLLRGEATFLGYLNPDTFVVEEDDKHILTEVYLSKKPVDRRSVRVRVTVKVLGQQIERE